MENIEIVAKVKLLADLLELYEENPFKVRALQNAYSTLKKIAEPIISMSNEEITSLPNIGKGIISAIRELIETGSLEELDKLLAKTPPGVVEMFNIKGIGPKKVAQFWMNMGLTSVGALVYHCTENRLRDVKGFGEKSQADILNKANIYLQSKNKWLFARLEPILAEWEERLREADGIVDFKLTGPAYRKQQIIENVNYIVDAEIWPFEMDHFEVTSWDDDTMTGVYDQKLLVHLSLYTDDLMKESFLSSFGADYKIHGFIDPSKIPEGTNDEREIFNALSVPYIIPELRWNSELASIPEDKIITREDILGVVHAHSNYSDGIHSIAEMCSFIKDLGYSYFAISDHSRAASYAQGLSIERVAQQHREIELLRPKLENFTLFKSIECDILADGSLDYPDDVLASFDFIIGSIHAGLVMDKEKATARIIKAVESPYLNILGHISSRLLLARSGYPLDYDKIIDACAANKVVIELNSNPQRLDIDYTYIPQIMEKGVFMSINPDAHSKQAIHDIRYGVYAGRAGGLLKERVINTLPASEFLQAMKK